MRVVRAMRSLSSELYGIWTEPPRAMLPHERPGEVASFLEREGGFVPDFLLRGQPIPASDLARRLEKRRPLTLDLAALNVFLRTGFFLDGATPFLELRRVSPPPVIIPPREIARDEAIDIYIELFRRAVVRRARARPDSVLALSGGRDSRHILLALHEAKAVPDILTVDIDTAEDAAVARALAERLGVRLTVVSPDVSIAGARQTLRAVRCLTTDHAWFARVARGRDSRAWWDGIGGDVLSAGHFLTERNVRLFDEGRLDQLAEEMTSDRPVTYFRDQSAFPRRAAVEAVYAELTRHIGAANPVGSMYFWNRTRVAVGASAFGLLAPRGQTTLAPYLDDEVWRFLASLPTQMVSDYMLHTDAIHRAYPAVADIPFAGKRKRAAWRDRVVALKTLGAIVRRRPSMPNAAAAARLLRSLVVPARVHDAVWVAVTWLYGDGVTELTR
jgi:Asparagine synthase (glutamine-hydrolyzing)